MAGSTALFVPLFLTLTKVIGKNQRELAKKLKSTILELNNSCSVTFNSDSRLYEAKYYLDFKVDGTFLHVTSAGCLAHPQPTVGPFVGDGSGTTEEEAMEKAAADALNAIR